MQYKGDNLSGVKRANRSAVLRILHERGGMSRKRLAEKIELTPAAITKIVSEMIDEGLLAEGCALKSEGAGRREVNIEINPQARCALGLFINLNQAVLSALWLDGTVIFSESIATGSRISAEALVAQLCSKLMELSAEHGISRSKILGIGIAVRGITSADGLTVKDSFGALDTEDCPLAEMVEKASGLKVVMANNVRALLAAHVFMSGVDDFRSRFFLRCEYGIGAALSIDNRIWHGYTEQCAEIGHVPFIRRGGKPCSCGKSGCLETVASPTAIVDDALAILSPSETPVLWQISQSHGTGEISLEDVFTAARNGDAGVAEIVERAVIALSSALKSVIYIIDPEEIVLYGRMFNNSYYLDKLLAEMHEGVDSRHGTQILVSPFNRLLEDRAAGLLMIESFMKNGGILHTE